MTIEVVVLVERVQEEDNIINNHEDMPSLMPRTLNNDDSSNDEDKDSSNRNFPRQKKIYKVALIQFLQPHFQFRKH